MILNELKNNILNNDIFNKQKNLLAKLSLAKSMEVDFKLDELSKDEIIQLVESSNILAETEDIYARSIAYKIITDLYYVYADVYSGLSGILYVILSKLGNFPAIYMFQGKYDIPENIPSILCYSLLGHEKNNTLSLETTKKELLLTDFQSNLWETLISGKSVAISAPTSAGKSFIIKKYLFYKLLQNNTFCAIYIVPTRALINQVQDEFRQMAKENELLDVFISSIPELPQSVTNQKKIFILTQERLELLLSSNGDLYADLVIVDEAHLISNGARGIMLESAIKKLQKRHISQFIFAAPYINNPNVFGMIFNLSNFETPEKPEATVSQNIVLVDINPFLPKELSISLFLDNKIELVGKINTDIDLSSQNDYLSNISYIFGKKEQSIVYASGKAAAEDIAMKIAYHMRIENLNNEKLCELSDLIKNHVHPDYLLAETVKYGVGFHYGTMPAIIRKHIEDAFDSGYLKFLVCTPTLLHGVNLPAKNLFVYNPTTGRNIYAKKDSNEQRDIPMENFDFWNLAGRAGRLGKEFCGNIYIINYNSWIAKPLEDNKNKTINSSINNIFAEESDRLISCIKDTTSSIIDKEMETAIVKLYNDYKSNLLEETLKNSPINYDIDKKEEIISSIKNISDKISIPETITEINTSVSPIKQQNLYEYLYNKIQKNGINTYLPIHPLGEFGDTQNNLKNIFARSLRFLKNFSLEKSYAQAGSISGIALLWMRGATLPQLIQSEYEYKCSKSKRKSNMAVVIRDTLDKIEQKVRFEYVNLSSCYINILKQVLIELDYEEYITSIPNIPLFLEMGAASQTTLHLLSLGFSRLAASIIRDKIPSANMSEQEIKIWLKHISIESMNFPNYVIQEIESINT